MLGKLGCLATFMIVAVLPVPAMSEVGPHAVINVSQDLLRAYKPASRLQG
jgi:hypothetical protein